ncbi:unnamed protein product [Parascedosporium putredinis]|uniref:Uncharacterized protein n=1 Tax=Parascedosporium putredinis TaxID=1442378 RepID=A0A9P1GVJ8_9PEZI|nr:unnamed protein product [Parascedosporium putredinis]CAI7987856.1 unnamed protein product [Parascedosporium putredinis]
MLTLAGPRSPTDSNAAQRHNPFKSTSYGADSREQGHPGKHEAAEHPPSDSGRARVAVTPTSLKAKLGALNAGDSNAVFPFTKMLPKDTGGETQRLEELRKYARREGGY